MPFAFTFYGTSYTSVQVSTEGFLEFAYSANNVGIGDTANTDAKLIANRIIAPLWNDLPAATPTSVYVNTSVTGQITIRWQSTNVVTNTPVNFDVVLFQNGQIRFDYGAGNANVAPTVGISFGNGNAYQAPAAYDNQSNLANANSILFSLQSGFVDMGAYEFQGSSLDKTPPTVTSTYPAVVNGGGAAMQVNELQVSFSEGLNPIDAAATALYQLVKAGSNGFGSANDVYYPVTASYNGSGTLLAVPFSSGTNLVTLAIGGLAGGYLPAGTYELTVFSNGSDSIHDLSGNALAGNGIGTPDSSYVRIFTVVANHFAVALTGPSSIAAGSSTSFTVTALDADNNLATNYTGVVTITSSDGQAVLPVSVTLTNGVGAGTATLITAGGQTLTATDPVTSISGTTTTISVQPTAPTQLGKQPVCRPASRRALLLPLPCRLSTNSAMSPPVTAAPSISPAMTPRLFCPPTPR